MVDTMVVKMVEWRAGQKAALMGRHWAVLWAVLWAEKTVALWV
jgi:hypothetical protein